MLDFVILMVTYDRHFFVGRCVILIFFGALGCNDIFLVPEAVISFFSLPVELHENEAVTISKQSKERTKENA